MLQQSPESQGAGSKDKAQDTKGSKGPENMLPKPGEPAVLPKGVAQGNLVSPDKNLPKVDLTPGQKSGIKDMLKTMGDPIKYNNQGQLPTFQDLERATRRGKVEKLEQEDKADKTPQITVTEKQKAQIKEAAAVLDDKQLQDLVHGYDKASFRSEAERNKAFYEGVHRLKDKDGNSLVGRIDQTFRDIDATNPHISHGDAYKQTQQMIFDELKARGSDMRILINENWTSKDRVEGTNINLLDTTTGKVKTISSLPHPNGRRI